MQNSINTKSDVYIAAGTVSNGATIPLPSGYSRSQCKYAIWYQTYSYTFDNYTTSDITIAFSASVVQSSGKVTCSGRSNNGCGYLVVAVK